MGVRFPSVGSVTIVNAAIVTTAETVICTTPPLTLPLDFAVVLLIWYIALTTGLSTTSLTARLRRGTTTAGVLVNVAAAVAQGATQAIEQSGCYIDTPGAVAGQQYSLTVTQAAATANGAVTDVSLIAFAL